MCLIIDHFIHFSFSIFGFAYERFIFSLLADKKTIQLRLIQQLQERKHYLFLAKKSFIKAALSSFKTPETTSVLGCSGEGEKAVKPLFSSAAP